MSSKGRSVTEVERHGIETIPHGERTARPRDIFKLTFGSASSFPAVVIGTLPVFVFGLSFTQAMLALVLGLLVGSAILAPMVMFGPRTGTNNAVSSGAHFGVVGRLGGSFLALLTALTFFALSVYTSGDVLVAVVDRLFGTGQHEWMFAAAYGFFAALILLIAVYGFEFMLAINKFAVYAATALFVVGFAALANQLSDAPVAALSGAGTSIAPAFISAVLIVAANPLSYGSMLGDWSRYIPAATSTPRLLAATFFGQMATVLPLGFGTFVASIVAVRAPQFLADGNFAGGLVTIAPGWLLAPVLAIAVIGGLAAGSTCLYGPGLDFSSIFPRLPRVQATLLIGVSTIGFVFLGRFAFDFVSTIVTFATLIVLWNVPWITILVIGYLVRRGHYVADDLQVFNRGLAGGVYWYRRGLNWRAITAWVVSSMTAMLFVNLPGQFEGPLRDIVSSRGGMDTLAGVDMSLLVGLGLAVVLYPALLLLFPEPREVFGETVPRWLTGRRHDRAENAGIPAQPQPVTALLETDS